MAIDKTAPDEPDWKSIALWLLNCEAATASGLALMKSGSKYEKNRHADMCAKAVAAIRTGLSPTDPYRFRHPDMERIINRAKDAADAIRKALQK